MTTCQHCHRVIVQEGDGWIDPEATGDDSVWRETCDAHDSFQADHQPGISVLSAAIAYGMDDETARAYCAVIEERDDYNEWWLETSGDWVIHAVPIPEGAPHVLDTEYGLMGRWAAAGVFVYDEEPDCAVSVDTGNPSRWVEQP